jgi:hypothetical protein
MSVNYYNTCGRYNRPRAQNEGIRLLELLAQGVSRPLILSMMVDQRRPLHERLLRRD